ncbi:MAG: GGDEF domain-containing protein [Candidatus Sumerlaeota bacterium]|nr:GGDEF domain-containing protein [Candidatus Sumerlaeota bacterium]
MAIRLPSKLYSLKYRLLIVTICNIITALCLTLLTVNILDKKLGWNLTILFPELILFLFIYIILSIITTRVILHPIDRLTREVHQLIDKGMLHEIDLSRYPELANLLAYTFELIESVKKERSLALLIKGASDLRIKMVRKDALTGLYDREYLDQYLPFELSRSHIMNQPVSVMMLDVDEFKFYNDKNGHPEGDQVLSGLADLLRRVTRNYDVCVRYGGEEFLVIMPRTPQYQALEAAERVRKAFENEPFEHKELQPTGNLTISIGVASFPNDANDDKDLIKRADEALYSAKRSGKNKVCTTSP